MRRSAYNEGEKYFRRAVMEYITAREAAKKWNVSERLIQQYCISGRIEGAKKSV